MPEKKAAPTPAKAAPKKRTPTKGEKLVCETCGIGIIVDEVDGVVAFEELICCGVPMKAKTTAAKKAPVAKKMPVAKAKPVAKKLASAKQ